VICILFGASVPVVLRADSVGDDSDFRLIGECYVHGIMDGEAMHSRILSTETKYFNITAQIAHRAEVYPSLVEQTSLYLAVPPEQQSKTSRTKPVTDSDAMQYRLHWTCVCVHSCSSIGRYLRTLVMQLSGFLHSHRVPAWSDRRSSAENERIRLQGYA
jgi:hypothetical protein